MFNPFFGVPEAPFSGRKISSTEDFPTRSRKSTAPTVGPIALASMGRIFGSMYERSDSTVQQNVKRASKQIVEENALRPADPAKASIRVDLTTMKNDDDGGSSRRSSFLPNNLEEPTITPRYLKNVFVYKGATVQNLESERHHPTVRTFCTGSKYIGEFNKLGFSGKGIYRYPHGVMYDGHFNRNGDFHGTGSLIYPSGQRIEGIWRNGKMVKGGTSFVSKDNATIDSQYCKMPDRRFQIEVTNDIPPAGEEFLTNDFVPRKIPPHMYDTGNGFYDPKSRVIIDYRDVDVLLQDHIPLAENEAFYDALLASITQSQNNLLESLKTREETSKHRFIGSMASEEKEQWTINKCRKAWDQATGYRPDFYEVWTAGYKNENFTNTALVKRYLGGEYEDELITSLSKVEPTKKISEMVSKDKGTEKSTSSLYSFIKKPVYEQRPKGHERASTTNTPTNTWSNMFMQLGNAGLLFSETKTSVFHQQRASAKSDFSDRSKAKRSIQIKVPSRKGSRRKTKASMKQLVARLKMAREIQKRISAKTTDRE